MATDPLYQLPNDDVAAVPSWRHGDTVGVVAFGGCTWTNPGPSTEKKKATEPQNPKMEAQ